MRKIVFANRKGGCGKTTVTINIGAALADLGKKVLVVDLDSQAHATYYLGENPYTKKGNLFEFYSLLLKGEDINYDNFIKKTLFKNIYLIPSSSFLNDLDLNKIKGVETKIKELVDSLKEKFDFILFDTSPSMDIMTKSGLIAADEIMIPVEMHPLSVKGLAQLVREIYKINKEYNKEIIISGIIPTLFNQRTRVYNAVLEELKKIFPEEIIFFGVRHDIKLAEAPDHQKPIIYYAPISRAAFDFKVIAKRILRLKSKINGKGNKRSEENEK